jgi:hypothetical protein
MFIPHGKVPQVRIMNRTCENLWYARFMFLVGAFGSGYFVGMEFIPSTDVDMPNPISESRRLRTY